MIIIIIIVIIINWYQYCDNKKSHLKSPDVLQMKSCRYKWNIMEIHINIY